MKTENDLLSMLKGKLEIAFRDEWDDRRPTRFEITETINGATLTFFWKQKPVSGYLFMNTKLPV